MHLPPPRCLLRPWQANDLASLVKHGNDREVWKQLRNRFPHPYTEQDGLDWIALASAEEPITNFAIVHQDEPVGGIGLILQSDIETGTAELGYWLGRTVWGQGLATEAVKALCRYAFVELKLRRVYAGVFAPNTASRRVLEKAGFELEGLHRQHVCKDGQVYDIAYYGLVLP